MKIFTFSLLIVAVLALSACTGDQGPAGSVGPQGTQGQQGARGESGPGPSEDQLRALIDEAITGRADELKGERGPRGPFVGIFEAALDSQLAFDTAIEGKSWLSGLTLPLNLEGPSTISVSAAANVSSRSSNPNFWISITATPNEPETFQFFDLSVSSSVAIVVSETLKLPSGNHTIHFMAWNESGAPIFKDIVMTALVVED